MDSKLFFIEGLNFEKIRKTIRENKNKRIVFFSDSDELNRKILEKEKIDILLLRMKERKDFSKQRNSGFNFVLAKLAKKNNVTIGIDFDEILNSKEKERAKILARIKQNIEICNKNNLKMKFITSKEKNSSEMVALGLVLGMPTKMTKHLKF
jgi:ribonuclease P/MRP protein subunit RPP1